MRKIEVTARHRHFTAAGLLLVALWAAIAVALHAAHERILAEAGGEGRNLAGGLAEQISMSVRVIDVSMRNLRFVWLRDPNALAGVIVRQKPMLEEIAVDRVLVFDENGGPVYDSLPDAPPVDASRQPYFVVHGQRGRDALYIGEPMTDPTAEGRKIHFTRPIFGRDGRFAGVLVFCVAPPALGRIYKDIQLGAGGAITLVRLDGKVLARSEDLERAIAASIGDVPGLGPADAPAGEFRRVSRIDGVERYYQYRKVPEYPLILYVGQAAHTVEAPYYAQRKIYLAAGALGTGLLGALLLLLVGRQREREAARRSRVRAEAELRLSEDRYRDLVEHSQDLICTHALDGRILSVNPAPAKALGYEPAEMLNMNLREVLAPRARLEFDGYIAAIQRDGRASGLLLVQTRSGETRLWEYNNSLRTEGLPEPIVRGMARDVSERAAAQKALEESQARLASIIDSAMDAIITVDETGRILVFNRAAEIMFRCNAADALGQSLDRFIPQRFHAANRDRRRKLGASGVDARGQVARITGRRADGEEFPFEAVYSSVTVRGRRLFTAMLRDIVGRIAAAEEQRDVLVKEVHHRIKNNLQGVIGLMREYGAAHPELNELVERMAAQVRAVALVHGMGGASAQDEVGLRELIGDISQAAAALARVDVLVEGAQTASRQIRISRREAVPVALLLNELLSNAIKHGANKTAEGCVRIEIRDQADEVRVRISNAGALPAPDFDLAEGIGLGNGLNLVKALMPREGARLEIVQEGARVAAELTLTAPVILRL